MTLNLSTAHQLRPEAWLDSSILKPPMNTDEHRSVFICTADARRRDEVDVGHRRGAATTPIRALRRRAPSGCGPQGCGAEFPLARSSHTAPGIARRSRLASGPG